VVTQTGGQAASLRADWIDAALGVRPADLILKNGRIANVFVREVEEGAITIACGRIVALGAVPPGAEGPQTEVRDVDGAYLLPGYVDAHMHVGGSYLPVGVLGAALLARGTTALATDFYELYAMAGVPGVEECVAAAEAAGLRLLFMSPAHLLGFDRYGTFAHTPQVEEFIEMGRWARTVAVNEPPPFMVLGRDESADVLRVLDDALAQRKVFEGHAVGLGDRELQAYLAAGASSDHEAATLEEVREKLRLGYRVIMREGSASRDLAQLAPLLLEYPHASRFVSVCSDELEPKDLIAEGHIDHKLRKLVAAGVDPLVALQTATINTAEYLGVADDVGSLAPGRRADVLVVDELELFRPRLVFAAGALVAEDGRHLGDVSSLERVPDVLRGKVVLKRPLEPADFELRLARPDGKVRVRVIGIVDGTLLSKAREHVCEVEGGVVRADPAADVLRVSVVERHTGSGRIGHGFVSGLKLHDGAVAMTYCHQHHNLLVIGTSEAQMARAAGEVSRLGGGIAVVRGDAVAKSLAFPFGGIMGELGLEPMAAELKEVEDAIWSLGCELTAPILAISFSVVPTIPAYGLTDFGFYDTLGQRFVEPILDV
jgi:adenine deaminase